MDQVVVTGARAGTPSLFVIVGFLAAAFVLIDFSRRPVGTPPAWRVSFASALALAGVGGAWAANSIDIALAALTQQDAPYLAYVLLAVAAAGGAVLAVWRGDALLNRTLALFLLIVFCGTVMATLSVWDPSYEAISSVPFELGWVIAPLVLGSSALLLRLRPGDAPNGHRRPGPVKASKKGAVPSSAKNNQPADVFISYKRSERPRVEAISAALSRLGLSVWFDAELRSGSSFDSEINKHVRTAKCVLVVWSQGAVASDWVRAEASIGRERGVLAAVMVEPCDLPPPFNLVHFEDLRTSTLHADDEAWLRTLERIGSVLGRPGLASFEALRGSEDAASMRAWLAKYATDPLAEGVLARIRAVSSPD